MTLKIEFQSLSSHKVLCLGVYEENQFPLPTQTWDNKLVQAQKVKKVRMTRAFKILGR